MAPNSIYSLKKFVRMNLRVRSICCIYHECSGMLKCEKDENLMECDVVSVNHEIDQCSFRQLERRGLFTTAKRLMTIYTPCKTECSDGEGEL